MDVLDPQNTEVKIRFGIFSIPNVGLGELNVSAEQLRFSSLGTGELDSKIFHP